jgi:hypothetical protein
MAESPLVDPVTILAQQPPGSALFSRNQLDRDTWEVSWLIREESARIATLHQPDIEFRAGAMEQGWQGQWILLIPILVRIGPEQQDNIFEAWLNLYAEGGGIIYLHDLARQDRLVLHFYGDRMQRERSLVISNQLKAFAQQGLTLAERFQPWEMRTFDRAREQLYARYPSVMALWQSLRKAT